MGDKPFNLDLLFLNNENTRSIGLVKELSIFESSSNNFNPNGLFSTEIFGRVGSEERNSRYGYINLHIKVLHPMLYKQIITLKKLYENIMLGKAYAKFDNSIKDFIACNANEGDTGYEFFLKNFKKIKLEDNGSDSRLFKLKLLNKFNIEDMLIDKFLVLPAGLRDYTINDAGKPSEDEVNDLYRKLMIATNTLVNINTVTSDIKMLDPIRMKIQLATLAIHEHFLSLMDGKKKFIQGKWSKRAIRDSTRNVITPSVPNIIDLTDKKHNISTVNTIIGLYQYAKAINPITKFNINTKFLNYIFDPTSNSATLIDKKTLKNVNVELKPKTKDQWMSDEGLNNIINKMAQEEIRSEPIEVEDYYLALIYDNGKDIRLVINTSAIPENIDKKYLRPITYAELIYLAIYKDVNKYPGFLTRYPVTNVGSIYPSIPYLKTTAKGRKVNILDIDWNVIDTVVEYPKIGETFYNSLSPNSKHLAALDADFDGDKCSYTIVFSEESCNEVKNMLRMKSTYIGTDGSVLYSASNTVIDVVTKTLSWSE